MPDCRKSDGVSPALQNLHSMSRNLRALQPAALVMPPVAGLQACFLTRGDLYVSWTLGRDTFDRLLIDGDHFVNNGNWMWLSASAFFSQFFRVYSPITFGKKYDKQGKFIKHFLPVLKVRPG